MSQNLTPTTPRATQSTPSGSGIPVYSESDDSKGDERGGNTSPYERADDNGDDEDVNFAYILEDGDFFDVNDINYYIRIANQGSRSLTKVPPPTIGGLSMLPIVHDIT